MLRAVLALFQIALTNLLLSSDNVLMIGLLSVRTRWPRRRFVLLWSMLVSLALQLGILFVLNRLFRISLLRSAFGLVICYMAFHLLQAGGQGRSEAPSGQGTVSLTSRIVLANLMMSFENEAALIALAGGDVWSAWIGICATAPLIFFGSHGIAWLLERYAFIVYAGAVYLFHIGVGLLLSTPGFAAHPAAGWALTAAFALFAATRYLREAGGGTRLR